MYFYYKSCFWNALAMMYSRTQLVNLPAFIIKLSQSVPLLFMYITLPLVCSCNQRR